jgi:hypothetical protein
MFKPTRPVSDPAKPTRRSRSRLIVGLLIAVTAALALAGNALASGGNYVFQGGTPYEQLQVRDALDASSFNWSIVPEQITITITPLGTSEAVPGQIWLDPSVLDAGEFSWGVVQHEYAHEVDFELLNPTIEAQLETALGGTVWCYADDPSLQHNQYGCERFASTLAWAYWQNPDNCMQPSMIAGESGGMQPAAFRALMTTILGPAATATPVPPASVAVRSTRLK